MVVKSQNERYSPITNGTKNPMQNAIIVGRTKIGQYFLMAFSTLHPPRKV